MEPRGSWKLPDCTFATSESVFGGGAVAQTLGITALPTSQCLFSSPSFTPRGRADLLCKVPKGFLPHPRPERQLPKPILQCGGHQEESQQLKVVSAQLVPSQNLTLPFLSQLACHRAKGREGQTNPGSRLRLRPNPHPRPNGARAHAKPRPRPTLHAWPLPKS